ncbi:hypothetical protein PV336_32545 [Streptomyces sp. MI02-2A]|uniref:hypothetical protein n=1 Tax=unclassified Streptomyces TaxID=2593676 RepID=UPI000740F75D|nr:MULTISPECIES: hypothetical protein [unclassified Streptomyces]KUJ34913.1 hypothetical protein ADL25_38855 [Streptomyces sp. NRRL F-5122]MDX3263886.1 hypothetical protein [Streptomyces sp. MI02-2A]
MTWNPAPMRLRTTPSRAASAVIIGLLLAVLLVFFVLPVIWLLLAPSKTAGQIVHDNPLSFGSFGRIGDAWRHLFSFENGAVLTWLCNSAVSWEGQRGLLTPRLAVTGT